MALVNWLTGAGFFLSLAFGDFGGFLFWACVWFPIAGSIKVESDFVRPANLMVRQNQNKVNVEGVVIKVSETASPTDNMALGMSMGEP